MLVNDKLLIGKNEEKEIYLLPGMANRHGLITGASGSGKTITLKVMAESFSDAGIPVFLSDVKGDLAGTSQVGDYEKIAGRVEKMNLENFDVKSYPVRFWDLYGVKGHPIRAKVEDIGPNIISIMLGLNETQEGILNIAFRVAKDENLPLIDLKDLRSILTYIGDNRKDYITKYGNITTQSVGGIQRSLITLENQGIDNFFGEPSLDIHDFINLTYDGKGIVNILDSTELFKSPDLYASFMLWLLTELFNKLPEVGDLDKPKIVFFFDEAHLLFNGMPPYRLKQITQVVKLIRSRGIGLYFISQAPTDIPGDISAQLGNRVQHTLRAYTPADQKIVKAAADAFRINPKFNTETAILELGTGEALVSFQTEEGIPDVVEKVKILPPQSMMGSIDDLTRNKVINASPFVGKYDEKIESDSAFEIVNEKNERIEAEKQAEIEAKEQEKLAKEQAKEEEKLRKEEEKLAKEKARAEEKAKKEAERKAKNNPVNKLERKIANRAADKVINRGLNKLLNKLWK